MDLTSTSNVVTRHLAGRRPRAIVAGRAAAVSVVLFEDSGRTRFVLIERASRGRNAGQWALPGGKVEDGETPAEAAMREANEEVGLPVQGAELLGQLDDFATATGFSITPFVLVAPTGWAPVVAHEEVHAVHPFDLSVLTHSDVAHWIPQPGGADLLQMRLSADVHVHPPTGAMLFQFRELALFGRDLDVTDFVQPSFTHV